MIDKIHPGPVVYICNIGYWIIKLRCISKHICSQINQEGHNPRDRNNPTTSALEIVRKP
jgi:hypothetical protein